jgi:hypothetical protein
MAGLDPDPWISQLSVSMACVLVCIPFVLIISIKQVTSEQGQKERLKVAVHDLYLRRLTALVSIPLLSKHVA